MVKIKRGNHETIVSMGSYENIFKPLGYTLINDNIKEPVKVEETETVKSVPVKKKRKQEEK